MNIRTKLRVGTFVTIASVLIFIASVFSLVLVQQKMFTKEHLAQKINESSFQLELLSNEYADHPGERQKLQWMRTYDNLSLLLDKADPLFSSPSEREQFARIRKSTRDSGLLFGELINVLEGSGNETVAQELGNQMVIKAQIRFADAASLAETSRLAAAAAGGMFMFAVIILGVLIVGVSLSLLRFNTILTHSIGLLGEGAKAIRAGNLAHTIRLHRDDELGELSDLFNAMTIELQTSRASLEQKVNERTLDLRKANAFLDAIIENIPNMIFLKDAKELRFVRFNKAGEDLIGLKRKDLIGKNDYDLFPKDQADFFVRKDRAVLSEGKLVDIPEEELQTSKQGVRILHTRKIPISGESGRPGFLLGISEDITERKEAEKNLQEASRKIAEGAREAYRFQLAVESSTDAVAIMDSARRIQYVNAAWKKLNGYTAKQVLGKDMDLLNTDKTDPVIFEKIREAMRLGIPFESEEIVNKRKDGTEYAAELRIFPVHEEGEKVNFFVGIHRDITGRKRMDRAKSEFVSIASHQLRTPLTEIRWALSSLEQEKLLPSQMDVVRNAHKASSHMAETIKAMLTISHIETGALNPELQDVNLRATIDEVCALYESMAQKKDIAVTIDCASDLTIRTDGQLLKEILSNLLTNSYKYVDERGKVAVSVSKKKDGVKIDVADNGCGIPSHEQERISEKFFRASNVVEKKEEGNGIGLNMVYSLVKLLSGTISFVSQENKGSTFSIFLPFRT